MKNQRFHFALIVAALVTALIALIVPTARVGNQVRSEVEEQLEPRIEEIEHSVAASITPPYSRLRTLDGRTVFSVQGLNESEGDWAVRNRRIITGEESFTLYICTTLSGCAPPVEEIEVCTPCNSQPPSPACEARHADAVAAFCAEFDCTDCE
jgi:hypothetical protein